MDRTTGNQLTPRLAEIFIDEIEKSIHKYPLSKNVVNWDKYVDGIIVFQ